MSKQPSKKFRLSILEVKNLTTRYLLKNSRIPGKREEMIQFHEWIEGGVSLELPRNTCAQGHSLEVVFQTEGARESDFKTEVTGKVIHIENVPGSHVSVYLKFIQFHNEDWEVIRYEFEMLQDRVENLFKKMKE